MGHSSTSLERSRVRRVVASATLPWRSRRTPATTRRRACTQLWRMMIQMIQPMNTRTEEK
jgi:hypothetical protein